MPFSLTLCFSTTAFSKNKAFACVRMKIKLIVETAAFLYSRKIFKKIAICININILLIFSLKKYHNLLQKYNQLICNRILSLLSKEWRHVLISLFFSFFLYLFFSLFNCHVTILQIHAHIYTGNSHNRMHLLVCQALCVQASHAR